MNLPVPNIYAYKIVGQPIAPRPITVAEVVEYLKLDPDLIGDSSFEASVNAIIDTAVGIGEKYTSRTFRESRFNGYLDFFVGSRASYEIQKSPLQSIETIEYQFDGNTEIVDSSDYYTTVNEEYSTLQPVLTAQWPSVDRLSQTIKITFLAGYSDGELPVDLKQALLSHIALMFSNRGDCNVTAQGSTVPAMPSLTKMVYDQYSILDLRIGL